MTPKRDRIITAAIALFAEKGFRNTSTAEIASQAGVAQGTLFYHFKNKEGILTEVLRELLDATRQGYDRIDSRRLSGYTCVERLLRSEQTLVEREQLRVRVLIRDMTDEVLVPGTCGHGLIRDFLGYKISLLIRFLQQGMADGSVRPLDAEKTAWFIDAAFYGILRIRLLKDLPIPPLAEHAIDLCLSALRPPCAPPPTS